MSNEKMKFNIVIVGSGFAGLKAANMLADSSLSVLLVDENIHLGGQLLRNIPSSLGRHTAYRPDYVKRIGFQFIDSIEQKKLTIINKAIVIGIYPGKRLLLEVDERQVMTVDFDVLLFATGARERFLPFPGWTLPGVYSTGLCQVLMKSSGVVPAREMVIGGSGLFLLAVAYEALKNGVRLPGILEQTGLLDKIQMIGQLPHQFSKFVEGARFLSRIYLSGVPVHYRTRIVEARGAKELEEVVTARVDRHGQIVPGSEKIYKTNTLAVGYGFVANIELPQLAGCDLEFAGNKGGWVVRVDDRLKTSLPDIYAAGEITGIGGALKSITEGEIAALSILCHFDRGKEETHRSRFKTLTHKRQHHLRFGEYFNTLYRIDERAILSIPDETIVCRCEDVKMGDIKKAVKNGYNTPLSLKVSARVGMGNCQGRTCGVNIYDIVSSLTHTSQEAVGRFSVRPPIKPVSIGALAEHAINR